MRDAFILAAVRTPRGRGAPEASKRPGALSRIAPISLVATLIRALRERHPIDAHVRDVVLGCSTQTGEQGANIAKIAATYAGLAETTSGVTVNRFCASALDAVAYAALKVGAGGDDLVLCGGVESMSRVPMMSDRGAWFADPEVARATGFVHMGVAADLLATLRGYSREALDAVAVESHARAMRARTSRPRSDDVIPVVDADGATALADDECPRDGVTLESLARFEPAFGALAAAAGDAPRRVLEGRDLAHLHTVATSPQPADGASLLLVGSREAADALGVRPRARVLATATACVDPTLMLTGNVPAVELALSRAGVSRERVARFECNESFAATVLDFRERLDLDPARVNPDGGAIALGHPLGATGGILLATLLEGLERDGDEVGVASTCAGAGLAQAVVIARA
ncbi:MAG: acetyl-CoA C-acyltransferase [Myxococcales bacterium]|nr:acetyl-CoA C-acyltransferase [Myxococcales bacterium]